MKADLTNINAHECLMKWAEVTALSLKLLEVSLQKEFPNLSSDKLRQKLIERLHAPRKAPFTEG